MKADLLCGFAQGRRSFTARRITRDGISDHPDRQLPKIRAGRSWLNSNFAKDMAAVRDGIAERKTDTGSMKCRRPN